MKSTRQNLLIPGAKRLLAVLTLSVAALQLPAATVTFIGDGDTAGLAGDFLDPNNWSTGALPKPGDDLVAVDSYMHDGPPGVLQLRSLLHRPNGRGFYVRTSLNVTTDVVLITILEFQREIATLTVGGKTTVEAGDLSFVGGLSPDRSTRRAPRMTTRELEVFPQGRLRFRWFGEAPPDFPGNSTPLIRVTGAAEFAQGSTVRLQLENIEGSGSLPAGEYLLLTAGSIKGLPQLDYLEMAPANQRPAAGSIASPRDAWSNRTGGPNSPTKPELRLSPDRRSLILVISENR